MKIKTQILLATLILISIMFACAPSAEEKAKVEKAYADSLTTEMVSSSAAVEKGKDSNRKFIRTADLRFKVKNVVDATYKIEDITNKLDGFVTFTELRSNIDHKTNVAITPDSTLETSYYTVVNTMTLRVPNTKLDTTLKCIATMIDFLDSRIIKADDVALSLLSNKLTQERVSKNEQRLTKAIDNRGKKLKETTTAEELLLNKQEQADNAKINNLSLQDQINFSTITLSIYQRQTFKRELVLNDKNIDEYKPSLGKRIVEALGFGWFIIENIIIFLINIWGLIVFVVLGIFIYKYFSNKRKK